MSPDAGELERRRRVLSACGLDPETPAVRGVSGANEVWVADEIVVRINARGVGRLKREARIAARLPTEARHPEILAIGDDGEVEWMLTRRARGVELGRAWRAMAPAQRQRAVRELADALAAVHATPCEDVPDDILPPHTLPLDALLALLRRVGLHGGQPSLPRDAEAFVTQAWSSFDEADRGLVHGDPHLENVLWDGEHVTALLDFEWSRPSWIHADVEILLSIADHPALFAWADHDRTVDRAAYASVPRWLAEARPSWFVHPRLVDRLALLHVSRTLGHLEESPDSEVRWRHLRAVLDGTSFVWRHPT